MAQQFTFPTPSNPNPANDPFARNTRPANLGLVNPMPNVAELSQVDDNSDTEFEAIKDMVPSAATSDAGISGMINLMRSAAAAEPVTPASTPAPAPVESFNGAELSRMANLPKDEQPINEQKDEQTQTTVHNNEEKGEQKDDEPADIKDEEVLPILDSILFKGYASETYHIRGCEVTLRTQFFWEDSYAITLTEQSIKSYTLKDTAGFTFQLHMLAMNLESFGGNSFPVLRNGTPDELRESMQTRVEFLNTLPTAIVLHLWKLRERFMKRIAYTMENFERLVKAF